MNFYSCYNLFVKERGKIMTKRKLNIEFIRIFAVIMTISIHVSNLYLNSFGNIPNSFFGFGAVFNSFARVCVPLFFMISGAFALEKEFDRKKYFERIFKFLIILIAWSAIYYFCKSGFGIKNLGKVITNSFFNANMTSRHLWYMYPLIGIYLALPFIQNMCKNMSRELENLFLILWFCLSGLSVAFLPLAKFITKTDIEISYPVPLLNSAYYLGYFIAGHILYKRFKNIELSKKQNILLIFGYILSSSASAIITYFVSLKINRLCEPTGWYKSALIILATAFIFILFANKEKAFKSPIISLFSSQTFGIYLSHMLFLNIIKKCIVITDINPLISVPVITLIVYLASWIFSLILSKIPLLKKLIA